MSFPKWSVPAHLCFARMAVAAHNQRSCLRVMCYGCCRRGRPSLLGPCWVTGICAGTSFTPVPCCYSTLAKVSCVRAYSITIFWMYMPISEEMNNRLVVHVISSVSYFFFCPMHISLSKAALFHPPPLFSSSFVVHRAVNCAQIALLFLLRVLLSRTTFTVYNRMGIERGGKTLLELAFWHCLFYSILQSHISYGGKKKKKLWSTLYISF